MKVYDPQQRGLTRGERAARARRKRARAHLERVAGERHREPAGRRRPDIPRVPTLGLAAIVLLGSAGAGAVAATLWRRDATLESVAVQGLHRVTPAEIAERSGLAPGASLADFDAAALSERLAEHGWIAEARALPLPSGRVLVRVDEREPAATLAGETPWAVDASGVPFAPLGAAEVEGLPRIAAREPQPPGEASADLAQAVALAQRLDALGLPAAAEIGVAAPEDPEGFSVRLEGVAPRIVLGRGDLELRLTDLAELLEAALPALDQAQQVDLRFQDQAVLDVLPPQGAEQAAAAHGAASTSNKRPAG